MKRITCILFVFFLCLGLSGICSDTAWAGPLSIRVQQAKAGRVENGGQQIIIKYVVTNTSRVEYISRLAKMSVTITGSGNGVHETYQRDVSVDFYFDPPLRPHASKTLTTRFTRRINWDRGMVPYKNVKVHVDRYTFNRAS